MFRSLRKSKIGIIMAILFGISLFFFKSGSRYSNFFNSDSIVAKVSNTSISSSKFNRTMQMNVNNFNKMIGKKMTGDEVRSFGIHSLTLQALINDAIFEDEYDNLNFKIHESVIAKKTKERIPQLYDKDNKLNEIFLSSFLQQQQLKIEDVVQIINYETRDNYFNKAFFDVKFPKKFSKKIQNYNNHQREISFLKFETDKVNIQNYIDENMSSIDEKLASYYNENLDSYMTEELRSLDYIIIDKKVKIKNLQPSDFDIEEYYKNNKNLFIEQEKRTYLQYNFKNIQEAEIFKKDTDKLSINSIIEFSKKNNIKFNKFENIAKDEILEEIALPLFKLKPNIMSEVIESSLAKHVIILESIKPLVKLKLKDIRKEIADKLYNIEIKNYYNNLIEEISENIVEGKTIENISNTYNLKIHNLLNISEKYDESDKNILPTLINLSFQSNKDFVSNIIEINEELSLIFNVTNITAPNPINYNKIEEQVRKDWERETVIKKIKNEIEGNKSDISYIDNLARKLNIEEKNITISKEYKDLPNNLITNIFDAKKNNNLINIFNKTIFVAKVNNILISKNQMEHIDIKLNEELRLALGGELVKNKKITTNDNLINALINQY